MKKLLLALLSLFIFTLGASVASACNICVPGPCPNPDMWWDCVICDSPPEGMEGSHYCVMYEDGTCGLGNMNCVGPGELLHTPFKASWQVASVRVLPRSGQTAGVATKGVIAIAMTANNIAHP